MAKQISVGVGGVVKKAAKVRVGVGGVVKTVKKGVCGIGGVVREFYGGERDGLCLYKDGLVDGYNWVRSITDKGTYLVPYGQFALSTSLADLRDYTKCTLIFTDDTTSLDSKPNGSILFYKYATDMLIVDTGYPRNPGGLVEKTFQLNEDGKWTTSAATNIQPVFRIMMWNSKWTAGEDVSDLKIHEIWFER